MLTPAQALPLGSHCSWGATSGAARLYGCSGTRQAVLVPKVGHVAAEQERMHAIAGAVRSSTAKLGGCSQDVMWHAALLAPSCKPSSSR